MASGCAVHARAEFERGNETSDGSRPNADFTICTSCTTCLGDRALSLGQAPATYAEHGEGLAGTREPIGKDDDGVTGEQIVLDLHPRALQQVIETPTHIHSQVRRSP